MTLQEELVRQLARDIAVRAERARVVAESRPRRSERGAVRLPRVSMPKWRHWAAEGGEGKGGVHCAHAAAIAGGC